MGELRMRERLAQK